MSDTQHHGQRRPRKKSNRPTAYDREWTRATQKRRTGDMEGLPTFEPIRVRRTFGGAL